MGSQKQEYEHLQGEGGETQTGKQDEVTEVRTISKKINTFLNDKKKQKEPDQCVKF